MILKKRYFILNFLNLIKLTPFFSIMSINKNKQKTYLLSILDFHIRIIPSPLMFHPTNFILDFLRVKEKGKEKNIIFNYLVVYSLVACSYKVNEVSPDRRIYSYKNCCAITKCILKRVCLCS